MTPVALRPYQDRGVCGLRDGIRAGHRKQVLVAPAGSGKTEIASYMLSSAEQKGSRALFIVDRVSLVDQTSERFDSYGIPHGVLQANHWRTRPYERLQVCSAQTLEKRGIPEDVSVVFVDEAHCMRKKVTEFLEGTQAVVVGLTATPFARGMRKIYSNVVNVATVNELIGLGFLVPLKTYAAKAISVAGLKVIGGEWSEKEIEERGLEIVGDIVSEWKAKTDEHFGGPVKTIVFSATVDHGEEICRQFNACGFRFEQISYRDGGDKHRRDVIQEFRKADSTIHGLVSCEVFTKGFDVPDVMCGISARPYRKSLSSHIQQMGRVMRPAPGKTYGLWLDHAGNALRFWRDVADIFESGTGELDDGKRDETARKEPTEKEKADIKCVCGCVLQPWDRSCPACGKERRRLNDVEVKPGQMHELGGKEPPRGLEDRSAVWAQLCTAASLKHVGKVDMAIRQAKAQYKDIYGIWPTHHYDPYANAPMSDRLKNRLLRSTIAWKKRQQAAA